MLADHVADVDADAVAWSQEIERLRDPSHWASLPVKRLRALGERCGLELEHEEVVPFELDFEDWLQRGSGGSGAGALIDRALSDRPGGTDCFQITERGQGRVLKLQMWLARWRKPSSS